jgi:predicted MFS family arabinose efflux permease
MINRINSLRLQGVTEYASIAAAFSIGILSVYTLPLLVSEAMDKFAMDPADAGLFASSAGLGRGVAAAVMSSRSRSLDLRRIAVLGAWIIIAANLGLVVISSFKLILILRLVAGVGEGMALTAACIAAAAHANPERAFGAAQITAGALAIVVLLVVPLLNILWGPDASFLMLAATTLVALPLLARLRRPRRVEEDQGLQYPNVSAALFVLAAFALFSLADISTWLFANEIGQAAGMDRGKTEAVLSGTIALALAGPALAMVIHVRFGRILPLVVSMAMLAVAVVMFTRASTEVAYVAAIIPLNFGFAFLTPYFMGALAELDEGGSWTSLANSVVAAVGIGGPLLAGQIANSAGYASLAWLTGPAIVCALLLMLVMLRRPDVRSAAAPHG